MSAPNFRQIPNSLRTPPFRWLRFLPLPSLTATALLLTGALAQPPSPSTQPTPSPAPPPPKPDAAAVRLVDEAIARLDPKQLGWLETKLRQQVYAEGLAFNAGGRYLCGPDHRLHLEMTVHLGNADGTLRVISDGKTVWEDLHIGKGEHVISSWDLKKVQETLASLGASPQFLEQFYRSQAFSGVVPLLQNVRAQMTFHKPPEEVDWQQQKVFKLTAVWSEAVGKNISPQVNFWPPFVPRECRLYLGKDHWPYRLEWFGPTSPRAKENRLLMEMEFLNPRFTAGEKPPADYNGQFTFDPGKEKVRDRTQEFTDFLTMQVRNQPKAPPKAADLPGARKAPQ